MKNLKEYLVIEGYSVHRDYDLMYVVQDRNDNIHIYRNFKDADKISKDAEHPIYMIERRDKKELVKYLKSSKWMDAESLSNKTKKKYQNDKDNCFGNDF